MPVMTGNVFFPPKDDSCNINVDLSDYATKAEVKALTGVDTKAFAKHSDVTKIKESVDKIERNDKKLTDDFDKLKKTVEGSDLSSVKKDIATNKSSTDSLRTKVSGLETKVNNNTKDCSSLTRLASPLAKLELKTLEAKVNKNTAEYGTIKTRVDNIKTTGGLPAGDYVKKTDYDKDKATYVKKTDYSTDKNKLLSTDEYEKDKRDELALKTDLTKYTKKDDLNTDVSTFLKSADASNPLKGYVEQKNFRYAITMFLRSSGVDNPLTTYAKKTYVDDKIKGIKGGTADLSGYVKQTDFITYKDKIQKDFGNYATRSQLMTLHHMVLTNYLPKKDFEATGIKGNLAALMGREFFNGTDGLINEHV